MQQKLEECRDILKQIPTDEGITIESLEAFKEMLTELERIRPGIHRLNPRELQIFELLGSGLTVKQIAERLKISAKTVETYRDRSKQKLNAENAHQVVFLAFRWMCRHLVPSEAD